MDIFRSINTNDIETIITYIKDGGNLEIRNHYQMTPLIAAAEEGRTEIVKLLIQAKANLNAKDKIGQTAVILAAGRNDAETLKVLIEAKADLNVKYLSGLTAYQTAVENGLDKAAMVLKKAGAK